MNTTRRLAVWIFVAATAAACASPSSRLGRLYASLREDVADHGHEVEIDPELAERHAERAAQVRQMIDQGEVKSGVDRFRAAVLLVEAGDPENLKLAEELAMQSAAQGEPLGRRVAAEAIDKQLVQRRALQRYGTQYEWVVALRAWRLYPIEPLTTDEDRRAMGVPPLTELYEGEKRLNEWVRKP